MKKNRDLGMQKEEGEDPRKLGIILEIKDAWW